MAIEMRAIYSGEYEVPTGKANASRVLSLTGSVLSRDSIAAISAEVSENLRSLGAVNGAHRSLLMAILSGSGAPEFEQYLYAVLGTSLSVLPFFVSVEILLCTLMVYHLYLYAMRSWFAFTESIGYSHLPLVSLGMLKQIRPIVVLLFGLEGHASPAKVAQLYPLVLRVLEQLQNKDKALTDMRYVRQWAMEQDAAHLLTTAFSAVSLAHLLNIGSDGKPVAYFSAFLDLLSADVVSPERDISICTFNAHKTLHFFLFPLFVVQFIGLLGILNNIILVFMLLL